MMICIFVKRAFDRLPAHSTPNQLLSPHTMLNWVVGFHFQPNTYGSRTSGGNVPSLACNDGISEEL